MQFTHTSESELPGVICFLSTVGNGNKDSDYEVEQIFNFLTPYLSGILGAKQLVVVIMQTTFSGPKSLICFSTAARSVRSSSPSSTFSTITGSNPGARDKNKCSFFSSKWQFWLRQFQSYLIWYPSEFPKWYFKESRGLVNVFSGRANGFHRRAKLFELTFTTRKKFPPEGQTR